jgi:hypothetical protein
MKYDSIWHWDGTFRDICISGVGIPHWQRVIDWLRASPYPIEFRLNDEPTALPHEVSEVFRQRDERAVLLQVDVGNVIIHCHFFSYDEIEFDVDPREVSSEQEEQGIIDFMRALGRLSGREVILTPENYREMALLTYIPEQDEVVHNPVSLEPAAIRELSREQGLRLMAEAYDEDQNDEGAIVQRMLDASNKPVREES